MIKTILALLIVSTFVLTTVAHAGSATWDLNPISNDWNTAANWTPAMVPNGPSDTATFNVSDITNITLSFPVEVNGITYSPGASSFTINGAALTLSGTGITNASAATQNFAVFSDSPMSFTNAATAGVGTAFTTGTSTLAKGFINFLDNASAGSAFFANGIGGTITFSGSATAGLGTFTNIAATNPNGISGLIAFHDSSSAGNGTFTNSAVDTAGLGEPPYISFFDSSSAADGSFINNGASVGVTSGGMIFCSGANAGHATFNNKGGTVSLATGGIIDFHFDADAESATITNGAGTVSGATGGILFVNGSSAGHSIIVNNGAQVAGAFGGFTHFIGGSGANSTIIANSGTAGGGGGVIDFDDLSSGGNARIEVFGNGSVSVANPFGTVPDITIGSIEGDGIVTMGTRNLIVGSNDINTVFSGVMSGGCHDCGNQLGHLTKIGTGRLTLADANTYFGGTTINQGVLLVTNQSGSATGTGSIAVHAGTLGGSGTVTGAVTVGTGSGPGASLAPAAGGRPSNFTTTNAITFQADGTYTCVVRARGTRIQTDRIIASRVTINGATFAFRPRFSGALPAGSVLTIINNTGASPISGTFSNLADAAIITANGTNFQANYEGGDGMIRP